MTHSGSLDPRDARGTKPAEGLDELRDAIDEIDRSLVDALARRKQLVDRVAAVKRANNLPVYHPAREEDLISKRRAQAADAGLAPSLVEDVFRLLLRESRVSQSAALSRHAVRPDARVLVVGGRGAMGASLVHWFSEAGYPVGVLDVDDWDRAGGLCRDVDLAVLAVPIEATPAVAARLGPLLSTSCTLADVTSTKEIPVAAMLAAHSGPVLGLHPMFGPGTSNLDKQIVVATPARKPAESAWVVEQLAAWGAVVVTATPQEHDRAMDIVQALRHFATFVFGQFLCRKNVDLRKTLEFSSPIYRLELGMVGRLFAQDPSLYAEIIFATDERRALLTEFLQVAYENLGMLARADRDGFREEFRTVARWFGPFGDQAMRESSFLIEKITERF